MNRSMAVVGALSCALFAAGCKGGNPGLTEQSPALARGQAADLRLTPDGKHALFLLDGEKPRLQGVPEQMLVGELWTVPTSGGTARKLGNGVTNVPGGYALSPDSRFALMLTGYNPVGHGGALVVADLQDPSAAKVELGDPVSYVLPSGDSKAVAFISEGVLRVGPLPQGPFREVAGEVHTAGISPDGKQLFFRRRLQAAAGLFQVAVDGGDAPVKLGEQVGDFLPSPDSLHLAFTQRSPSSQGNFDLYLASAPAWKVQRVAVGVGGPSASRTFGFSPDGAWLARMENGRPDALGELHLGPSTGGPGRKVGSSVHEFEFSPDSQALAFLERYDLTARAGVLSVAGVPEGEAIRIGSRVPNYGWAPDGRSLAFISRFLKPMYTVDLMLYRLGEVRANKVHQDVFAYSHDPGGRYVLYRSGCIREGRACNLYQLDLQAKGGPHQPRAAASLRALQEAKEAFAAKENRPAQTFAELGFQPEGQGPYTLCLGKDCLPCTTPGCEVKVNPCERLLPAPRTPAHSPGACAYAQLDEDAELDVWLMDPGGQLAHEQNDLTLKILEGVYSFRTSGDGERLLVTHARMDSKLYDLAVYSLERRQRKLVAQHAQLPALFTGPDGAKVVYIGAARNAAGVYSADLP